jgi:hypothetical protein
MGNMVWRDEHWYLNGSWLHIDDWLQLNNRSVVRHDLDGRWLRSWRDV